MACKCSMQLQVPAKPVAGEPRKCTQCTDAHMMKKHWDGKPMFPICHMTTPLQRASVEFTFNVSMVMDKECKVLYTEEQAGFQID